MIKQFSYKTYRPRFKNVPEVLEQMQNLQEELKETNLDRLKYFNLTYYIITKNVYTHMQSGYFSNTPGMQQLDCRFAQYYFDALKKYCQGKKTTPAWEVLFNACQNGNAMPLIYLALGVNAHVINDLGLSLYDTFKDKQYKNDFYKVNRIISASLDETISELKLKKFYKPFMNILIKRWRDKAWHNFEQISTEKISVAQIEQYALKIAKHLTKIHTLKGLHHLLKVF